MRHADDTCPMCGGPYIWGWEEAFEKFGFNDGNGLIMTPTIADTLRDAGYAVTHQQWGLHNDVITEIARDGRSLIPEAAHIGYDDPREYLPADVVALLDRELPSLRGAS